MIAINYKVSEHNRFNDMVSLTIENTDKKYKPLLGFFSAITARLYPETISNAVEGYGMAYNDIGVTFPKEYEDWEEGIDDNMVLFSYFEEKLLFPRIEYLKILLDMSKIILKVQKDRGQPTQEWLNQIEDGIKKLEEYIKNPDFKV